MHCHGTYTSDAAPYFCRSTSYSDQRQRTRHCTLASLARLLRTRPRRLPHSPINTLHLGPIVKPSIGHLKRLTHMFLISRPAQRMDAPAVVSSTRFDSSQNGAAVDRLLGRQVVLLGQIDECGESQQGGRTGQRPEGLVLYPVSLAQVQDWGQLASCEVSCHRCLHFRRAGCTLRIRQS